MRRAYCKVLAGRESCGAQPPMGKSFVRTWPAHTDNARRSSRARSRPASSKCALELSGGSMVWKWPQLAHGRLECAATAGWRPQRTAMAESTPHKRRCVGPERSQGRGCTTSLRLAWIQPALGLGRSSAAPSANSWHRPFSELVPCRRRCRCSCDFHLVQSIT